MMNLFLLLVVVPVLQGHGLGQDPVLRVAVQAPKRRVPYPTPLAPVKFLKSGNFRVQKRCSCRGETLLKLAWGLGSSL